MSIPVTNGGWNYIIKLEPPVGQTLTVGAYEGAVKAGTQSGANPGLLVTSNRPGSTCTTVTGRFVIDELVISSGVVEEVAAHIEHHCNGADAALFIVIANNSGGQPIPLSAHSFFQDFYFLGHDDSPLAFGDQSIGLWSGPKDFIIGNTSVDGFPLAIAQVTTTGTDASQFLVTDDFCSGETLQPDEFCTVSVIFAPTGSPGARNAKLTIFDAVAPVGGTGRDVVLTGTAVALVGQGEYTPITPVRIVDMRIGLGWPHPPGAYASPGENVHVQVTGVPGVPDSGVAAAVVNITLAQSIPTMFGNTGYATAYPTDAPLPLASNLNWEWGQIVAGLATVRLGADGAFNLYSGNLATKFVVDVVGYYSGPTGLRGGRFHGLTPARILDTRTGAGPVPVRQILPNEVVELDVRQHGVGATVNAVVLNLTATAYAGKAGALVVYPGDLDDPPLASNLNFTAGVDVANLSITGVPASGKVKIKNLSILPVHVIADVVGWYDNDYATEVGRFVPLPPVRFVDTRPGQGGQGPFSPNQTLVLDTRDYGGVPPVGYGAIVANITATGGTSNGWFTAFPADTPLPLASNLNFRAGKNVPNAVMVKVSESYVPDDGPGPGENGWLAFNNGPGFTHLVVDVSGYFTDENVGSLTLSRAEGGATPVYPILKRPRRMGQT